MVYVILAIILNVVLVLTGVVSPLGPIALFVFWFGYAIYCSIKQQIEYDRFIKKHPTTRPRTQLSVKNLPAARVSDSSAALASRSR
jgi:hypothetical protein